MSACTCVLKCYEYIFIKVCLLQLTKTDSYSVGNLL